MHAFITTVLVTACSLLRLAHSSPLLPLPHPLSLPANAHNHKPQTQPDRLLTGSNKTYVPTYPNPGILAPLPSWFQWPPPDTLAVTPRFKPIYTTDELIDFIVDVPKDSLETVVTLTFGGDGSKPFEASVHPGANIISVPKSNIVAVSTTVTAELGHVEASATFTVYQEPAPEKSHIVRVDHLHGSLVPQHGQGLGPLISEPPVFPFGMYASFGNFGEKDPIGAMKELKAMGFNHVNFVPPYGNGTQIEACIKAAQDVGVSIQYDMRHTDSATQFSHAADIIMTDVYPVGLNPAQCDYSPEGSCCGCNGCFGDLGTDIRRRMQSYRSQLAKICKPRLPIWMVLQAFSDPSTCWSRDPTPEEYRLMAYLSLIYGAKGLMGWIYPTALTDKLKASMPGLSAELVPFASRFILGGDQALEYTDIERQISAGSWVVDGARSYVVANTGDKVVTLTDAEVATIFGLDTALVGGRRTLESLAVLIFTTA
ncbi:hypothetical protein BGZ83_009257 [Gryganskiella cystojenkinii]|nr:hypothetical protein BGZ83_009257 [Gryganskiella cystojenkinii]